MRGWEPFLFKNLKASSGMTWYNMFFKMTVQLVILVNFMLNKTIYLLYTEVGSGAFKSRFDGPAAQESRI